MTRSITWVVIADAGRCRIFETADRGRTLSEALDQDLVADHRASRDLDADRPGRTFDRAGGGRHAKAPRTDPHRHAQQVFAHEIAHRLQDDQSRFDRLILVAPPSFLGDLRAALSDRLASLVSNSVARDLTKVPETRLADALVDCF